MEWQFATVLYVTFLAAYWLAQMVLKLNNTITEFEHYWDGPIIVADLEQEPTIHDRTDMWRGKFMYPLPDLPLAYGIPRNKENNSA